MVFDQQPNCVSGCSSQVLTPWSVKALEFFDMSRGVDDCRINKPNHVSGLSYQERFLQFYNTKLFLLLSNKKISIFIN